MQNSSLKVKGRQTVNVNGCKLVNLFFFFFLKKNYILTTEVVNTHNQGDPETTNGQI